MVLLKNVGKYGGASFPFYLVWGAAGVYHSTSESAGLGWGGCLSRQGLVYIACTYNTIHTYIHAFHGSMCHTEVITSHKYTYTNIQCQVQQTFYKNILNHLYT
jgi:hypothetical protein